MVLFLKLKICLLSYIKYSAPYLTDQKKQFLTKNAKICDLQEFDSEVPVPDQGNLSKDRLKQLIFYTNLNLFKNSKLNSMRTFLIWQMSIKIY